MSEVKIKYLAHPVTPEDKAKWVKKGFKIVDERFNPNPKKTRAPKPVDEEPTEENTAPDVE